MKIRFLSGPRSGETDHAPNTQETQLLAKAGIIEIIPWKNYHERLASETPQVVVPPTVEWGIRGAERGLNSYSQTVIIKRTSLGETTFFSSVPPDCPKEIANQFRALTGDEPVAEVPKTFLGKLAAAVGCTKDGAAAVAQAAFVGDSNQHAKVCQGYKKDGTPIYLGDPVNQ